MSPRGTKRSGVSILRPRAQMLRRIGDELISSEAVAVIELVKNAYDADATRVLVRFQERSLIVDTSDLVLDRNFQETTKMAKSSRAA